MKKLAALLFAGALALMPSAASAASAAAQEELMIPSVVITERSRADYNEETWDTYCSFRWAVPSLDPVLAAEYPALQEALLAFTEAEDAEKTARYEEMCYDSRQWAIEGLPYEAFLESSLSVERMDDQVLCLRQYSSSYTGGAHGYYYCTGHTFDAQTGEKLALTDVIADEQQMRAVLEEELLAAYDPEMFFDLHETLTACPMEDFSWTVGPAGVTFFFNPYEIAAYAAGMQTVTLSFARYPELFTGRVTAASGAFVTCPAEGIPFILDLDGDGAEDNLLIGRGMDENYMFSGYEITMNGQTLKGEYDWFEMMPVLLHTADGKCWLYLDCVSENEYHGISVIGFADGAPYLAGTIPGGFGRGYDEAAEGMRLYVPADPSCLRVDTRINMLGTWQGRRICSVGADGLPVPQKEWYTVTTGMPLKTIASLSAQGVDAESAETTGEAVTVPSGEELRLARTDGETWADLCRPDGSMVRVYVDTSGWPRMINGMDEDSYFEMLPYAG